MGSKASLQLRDEEVVAIQKETGCKLLLRIYHILAVSE